MKRCNVRCALGRPIARVLLSLAETRLGRAIEAGLTSRPAGTIGSAGRDVGTISAFHHGKARLVFMAPLAIYYVLLAYSVWLTHGLRGLITGRELSRDKPTRYAHVVA